jgi:drug/metabolite transporter (DMT)-like permease
MQIAPVEGSRAPTSRLVVSYVAVCTIWGSTYLAIAIALEGFPPFFLGALRFLAAGLTLIAVARLRREPWPTRSHWLSALIAGGILFVFGNGLINVAERSLSSSVASVLVATMPLWMTVFGRLLGEPLSRREVIGVVIGLGGVCVMNFGGDLRASPGGVILALLSPMAWALGSLASKRLPSATGTMKIGAQMLCGGALMAIVGLLLGERVSETPSMRAILATVYLYVFGSLIGFSAYTYLLKHTRPAIATSYAYINPVVAVLLGVLVADETFDVASGAGAAIILAATILVTRAHSDGPAITVVKTRRG